VALEHVLVHYRPEERAFVQRVVEVAERVDHWQSPILLDFLDPRQTFIAENITNTIDGVNLHTHGGWEKAERVRVLVAPTYQTPDVENFELTALRIEAPTAFVSLRHGDYLGALLGLGLKRTKLGDVVVHSNGCDCVVASDISDYVRSNLISVGRASVSVKGIDMLELATPDIRYEEKDITVSSLRLDAIACQGFGLSRSVAQSMIKASKVQLNWKLVQDATEEVAEGDIISLRGSGRMRVLCLGGPSRKGRLMVTIGRYL